MSNRENPFISVIVPVYNTAPYLERCLDSLRAQTLENMEFLLIDDGSTDASGEIIDRFGAADPRFRCIHQENRGFAGARNRGLDEARGEFIGFVDSDDWIDPLMYRKLFDAHLACPEADIVQCAYCHEYPEDGLTVAADNAWVRSLLRRTGGKMRGAEALLLDDSTVWNRIYRRSMLETKGLRFDAAMAFGEDCYFYFTAMASAERIAAIGDILYHYRRNRPGSQVVSGDRRVFAYFTVLEGAARFAAEHGMRELEPWINHLCLSYPAWGFERLQPELREEYFGCYRSFLRDAGISSASPIAYPPLGGGMMRDLRYLLLRILHPLTRRAILRNHYAAFCRIVAVRRFLAELPLKLRRRRRNG